MTVDSPSLSDMRDSQEYLCLKCDTKFMASPEGRNCPACFRERQGNYALLSPNVESCINTLLLFVEDRWPAHYREGALRSLRFAVNEWIADIKTAPPVPSVRPPTDSVPLSEMLDELVRGALQTGVLSRDSANYQSIESFVTALTTELEDLREENQRLQALVVDEAELERIARSLE